MEVAAGDGQRGFGTRTALLRVETKLSAGGADEMQGVEMESRRVGSHVERLGESVPLAHHANIQACASMAEVALADLEVTFVHERQLVAELGFHRDERADVIGMAPAFGA